MFNKLYFFSFDAVNMHWMFRFSTATTVGSIDPAGFGGQFPPSIAMWNGLTAWGSPELAQSSPFLPVNSSSNCNGTATGYVKYLTWDGLSTWRLQPVQLVDPGACSANNCGASVAVGPDGLIVAGCPAGEAVGAGQSFGYAIAWSLGDTPDLVASHTDARYPQQAWLWEPPADQRGDGGVTSATGFGWGVALSRQSIVFGGPLTKQNGRTALLGSLWVTRCTNVTTCYG